MYSYARENLALVNVYIKDPAVTQVRIGTLGTLRGCEFLKVTPSVLQQVKRDQKVPTIWFIANIGGILGLSMGCSLVTIFEILHHAVEVAFREEAKFEPIQFLI